MRFIGPRTDIVTEYIIMIRGLILASLAIGREGEGEGGGNWEDVNLA